MDQEDGWVCCSCVWADGKECLAFCGVMVDWLLAGEEWGWDKDTEVRPWAVELLAIKDGCHAVCNVE